MIAVVVTGNVGKEPEQRGLPDGGTVLTFSMASNSREKREGEWVNVPTWVRVSFFGKRAEGLAKVLAKGSSVIVRGTLTQREYEKEGVKHQILECRADDVEFAGSKRDDGGSGDAGHAQAPAPAQQPRQQAQQPQGNGGQRRGSGTGYGGGGGGQQRQPRQQAPADDGYGDGGGPGGVDESLPF